MVENLFLEQGSTVISHNRPAGDNSTDPHTNSSRVIIGISLSTPGGLTLPHKDESGRALAACVPFDTDLTLRFVGTYGPSAAMAPRSPSGIQGIREERSTAVFVSDQMDLAFRKGWLFLVAGDFNSIPSLLLDREGGDYIIRNESLAIIFFSRGAVDSFRWRHPDLRAFSCVHPNGTASRLDQIMVSPPASHQVTILNAAIIDDSRYRRDHLIPLLDIGASIPSVSIPERTVPNWKRIVSIISDEDNLYTGQGSGTGHGRRQDTRILSTGRPTRRPLRQFLEFYPYGSPVRCRHPRLDGLPPLGMSASRSGDNHTS